MTKKKRTIFISILVLLIIVVISTLSYAYVNKKFVQQNANVHNFNCFDIEYAEEVEEIMQLNSYPQTDGQGLENKPYQITITNKCDYSVSYDVIMHKSNTSNLDEQYVKVSVDGNIKKYNEAPSVTTGSVIGFTPAISRRISTGVLGPQGKRKLNIRTWMDENTSESAGSNKTFDFKVTIEATVGNGSNLLAKAILNQGVKTEIPSFSMGEPPTDDLESAGSGLFKAEDDDGTSYYFRGDKNLINNYVYFASHYWRIVRINGDGTIRLILDDNTGSNSAFNSDYNDRKYVGFTYDNNACTKENACISEYKNSTFTNSNGGTNSTIKNALETWYKSNLTGDSFNKKIAYGTYCNDTSFGSGDEAGTLYYGAYERLANSSSVSYGKPTLKCPEPKDATGQMRTYGGIYKLKIGLLTADEMNYAGLPYSGSASSNNYLYKSYYWWGLSPYYFYSSYAHVFGGNDVYLSGNSVRSTSGVRPVINLTSDTLITSGDGSTNSAFEVE